MPSTTKGLPYPSNSDDVDVPGDIQALAEAVDTELNDYLTTASASSTYQQIATVPSPNRSLLYNGAMQVSQRGTSTAGITSGGSGYFTADRWNATYTNLGTFTQSVENDAPTGSGFRRSLKMLCTTADASPAAGDYMIIQQILEGQDLQRIAKGTASAQQLTLSFWVKSNTTGTYIAELNDIDNTRRVSASYTISASATWERKTITFPLDTTGAFDNDNAGSLELNFWLGAGSTFSGGSPLQTSWGTATNTRATGQTNLAAATNNYWQITGVQLEVGSQATAFEFKSYGEELAECQRYYYLHASGNNRPFANGANISATQASGVVIFPVTMRSDPSISVVSGTGYYAFSRNGADDAVNSLVVDAGTNTAFAFTNVTDVSGTAGHAGVWLTRNAAASVAFAAEL